ncbi:MAG: hypothetical protein M1338_01220, partial [Patescibacteria group bacterium]|nr:hypothetical protein [Patescibacteria group bacterium]
MNMAVTDVTELKTKNLKLKTGDEVVIIGQQTVPTPVGSGPRSVSIGADKISNKTSSINYEIVTRIPEHIKRIYK